MSREEELGNVVEKDEAFVPCGSCGSLSPAYMISKGRDGVSMCYHCGVEKNLTRITGILTERLIALEKRVDSLH